MSATALAPSGPRIWLLAARPATLPAAIVPVLVGSGAALQDLLMGLRFEADSQGYEGVRLFAPVPHPASDDFAEVGYHLADGQVQRYAYARELTG